MTLGSEAATEGDLFAIRTFSSESEARIAKGALEAFGIDCMLSHDDCGGQRAHLTMAGGVRLIIRSGDMEQAEEVLAAKPQHEEPSAP